MIRIEGVYIASNGKTNTFCFLGSTLLGEKQGVGAERKAESKSDVSKIQFLSKEHARKNQKERKHTEMLNQET